MKSLKKTVSVLSALSILICTLCSCGNNIEKNRELVDSYYNNTTLQTTAPIVTELEKVTTIEQTEITPEKVSYKKFSKNFQADEGELSGNVKFSKKRKDFTTEKGYATGFSDLSQDDWGVTIKLPETQYYSIAISVGAEKKVSNSILIDGVVLETFTVEPSESSKGFQNIIFENIYIEKGEYTVSFGLLDGGFDLDRMVIASSNKIGKLDLSLQNPKLTNTDASKKSQKVYDFLCDNYGKSIISGQYASLGSNDEIYAVYKETGKYPVIRFSDLMAYTNEDISQTDEIGLAEEWSKKGGIVGFSWHWAAPMNESGFYSKDTEFDLSKACTSLDIHSLDFEEIAELCDNQLISEECVELVRDIDLIASKLALLRDRDIPVLFRPLHEASGGWFWWGCDKDSYQWLWKLLYNRLTSYHSMDNLIWVWNAQNPDWYVGDDYCDIISADIYQVSSSERQVNAFLSLNEISKTKPVALSECDNMLSPEIMARDKTCWSYFGFWCGDYLIDENGKLNEKYIPNETLQKLYNNSFVLTLDDVGGLF